jgi:hypothetical protein
MGSDKEYFNKYFALRGISEYVQFRSNHCNYCVTMKGRKNRVIARAKYKTRAVPTRVWEVWAWDVKGPFPKGHLGFLYVCCVVEQCTNFMVGWTMRHHNADVCMCLFFVYVYVCMSRLLFVFV